MFDLHSYRRLTLLTGMILSLVVIAVACQAPTNPPPAAGRTDPPAADPSTRTPTGWYSVYFSDPQDPSSQKLRGGPDQDLAQAIDQARLSVDVAVLQLDLWSIRDALIDAQRRGVRVRMVTESDYLDEDEVQDLLQAGIQVVGDRREGLMHNKFLVIDRLDVWTGSMNFTVNEAYRNNNNLIRIRSELLAQNYTAEFEEMFLDDEFGPGSPATTPNPDLTIAGSPVESCFSPDDGCTARLVEAIASAQQDIVFLAYSFTSDELAQALMDRLDHGVQIAGVIESGQATTNRGSKWSLFQSTTMDIILDSNPNQMHEKVMVIDKRIVAMGSFNFTYSAETRNDENLLIIENPALAAIYLAEFNRIYQQAQQFQ